MPEIARFFGIIITIYMEVEKVHQIPHFHVRYGGITPRTASIQLLS